MPGRDRTGPAGQGAMSGRRMGLCAGNGENIGFGRCGRGRKGCGGYGGSPQIFNYDAALQEEKEWLKKRLEIVEKELEGK